MEVEDSARKLVRVLSNALNVHQDTICVLVSTDTAMQSFQCPLCIRFIQEQYHLFVLSCDTNSLFPNMTGHENLFLSKVPCFTRLSHSASASLYGLKSHSDGKSQLLGRCVLLSLHVLHDVVFSCHCTSLCGVYISADVYDCVLINYIDSKLICRYCLWDM